MPFITNLNTHILPHKIDTSLLTRSFCTQFSPCHQEGTGIRNLPLNTSGLSSATILNCRRGATLGSGDTLLVTTFVPAKLLNCPKQAYLAPLIHLPASTFFECATDRRELEAAIACFGDSDAAQSPRGRDCTHLAAQEAIAVEIELAGLNCYMPSRKIVAEVRCEWKAGVTQASRQGNREGLWRSVRPYRKMIH